MSEYGIKPYSKAIIKLLKGVVENNDVVWNDLLTYQADIQNYISTMGGGGWSLSLKRMKDSPLLNRLY